MFKKTDAMYVILLLVINVIPVSSQNILLPVDSVRGPMCVITDSVTKVAIPLSPKQSVYNVIVTDGLAQIVLTQMFVNDYGPIRDVAYVFPLPHDAAVHGMKIEYRGSIYKAIIYEKQEAQKKYDSVVATGAVAALLLQERPNVFQQRVANIAYGDTAWVEIKLTMPLKYDNGKYEVAIPTMVAERYQSVNASSVPSSNRLWNPPPDRDGQTLQINILLQAGFPIAQLQSPTHPLVISEIDAVRPVLEARRLIEKAMKLDLPFNKGMLLQQSATYPNKDFVLQFSRAAAGLDFTMESTFDTTLDVGYFYSNIFPDTSLFSGERAKLDVVILVDVSGSQAGWPLAKEKEIANAILDKLAPGDRLTVLSFSDNVYWCFGTAQSVEASSENITTARNFINKLTTLGGTNLLGGVQAALGISSGTGFSRFFVFLTDGNITNESAILTEIKNHASHPTIFTFGAGDNLNRYFLDEAAKVGSGVSTEITSAEEVAPKVASVWNKIESPQLRDLSITCSGLDNAQLVMPQGSMLYKGSPVTIFGVYRDGGNHVVTITGNRNGEIVKMEKEVSLAAEPTANSMIPQVWARQMIRKLRMEEGTGTANKNHIIELSKQYQVLSDYTAFLAISPVKATEDNQLRYTSVEFSKLPGDLLASLSASVVGGRLIIEARSGVSVSEVAIFDLKGRCIFRRSFGAMNCIRFIWDGRLDSGVMVARGSYLVNIVTSRGLVTRSIRWK